MPPETESNPYEAPHPMAKEFADSVPSSAGNWSPGSVDFAVIIRRWERLRLFYNGILILFVLLITFVHFPGRFLDLKYWLAISAAGLFANLLFLLGPAIEGYGRRLRCWNGIMTMVLFLAGLAFTGYCAIAFIAVLTGTF